jgi:hypothetical protein
VGKGEEMGDNGAGPGGGGSGAGPGGGVRGGEAGLAFSRGMSLKLGGSRIGG